MPVPLKRKGKRPEADVLTDLACSRFYRFHELGMSKADIAREDGVGIAAVDLSLMRVRAHRARYNSAAVIASQSKLILETAELEKAALAAALQATTMEQTGVDDEDKPVFEPVPNHQIRLQASEIITEKVAAIQPKGNGKSINVQTNVGVVSQPQGPAAPPRGLTVEERLRELQAKRQGLLTDGQNSAPAPPSPVEAYDAEAELIHDEG